jgi:drug/metabolite transporter (DMT)-like permease
MTMDVRGRNDPSDRLHVGRAVAGHRSASASRRAKSNQRQPHGVDGVVQFDFKLVLAIGTVWFIWGSTFAGMHYAVATIPPFAMAAARFFLAGTILYAFCAARGRAQITRSDLKHAAITGAALLLLGNGISAYTVQYLPTGINALLLSLTVIWMALIGFLWGGERPSGAAVAGMILGLIGLALLVQPQRGAALPPVAVGLAVFASMFWAFGSIYQRRVGKPPDVLLATALQMIAGGLLLALEAAVSGEWRAFNVQAVSAASLAGFGWLVVFGSIIAYSAYQYTMHAAPAALASTYAYVNPIVSVILGYALFGERLTLGQGIGSAVVVLGVALMMWPGPGSETGDEGRLAAKPQTQRAACGVAANATDSTKSNPLQASFGTVRGAARDRFLQFEPALRRDGNVTSKWIIEQHDECQQDADHPRRGGRHEQLHAKVFQPEQAEKTDHQAGGR